MEDLNHYLKMFNKGDYKSFPKVKVEEWSNRIMISQINSKYKNLIQ